MADRPEPTNSTEAYRQIIDELATTVSESGGVSSFKNLRSLSKSQRALVSRMLLKERESAIHDVLANLWWWINVREVQLTFRGEPMPIAGEGLHGDYIARRQGINWPSDTEKEPSGKPIDSPLVGRLVGGMSGWETGSPPPPIDSLGRLAFRPSGGAPTEKTLRRYAKFVGEYSTLWPKIARALLKEYRAVKANVREVRRVERLRKTTYALPDASNVADIFRITRLVDATFFDDSIRLAYGIYGYSKNHKRIERLDPQINVTLKKNRVAEVQWIW